jgi:hypothetical protein
MSNILNTLFSLIGKKIQNNLSDDCGLPCHLTCKEHTNALSEFLGLSPIVMKNFKSRFNLTAFDGECGWETVTNDGFGYDLDGVRTIASTGDHILVGAAAYNTGDPNPENPDKVNSTLFVGRKGCDNNPKNIKWCIGVQAEKSTNAYVWGLATSCKYTVAGFSMSFRSI